MGAAVAAGAERGRALAVAALGSLAAITAAWWALALWPVPGGVPEWLARARFVCFNAGPDGLPDASGWLLLVGEPIGMLAVLLAVWGEPGPPGLWPPARAAPVPRPALGPRRGRVRPLRHGRRGERRARPLGHRPRARSPQRRGR